VTTQPEYDLLGHLSAGSHIDLGVVENLSQAKGVFLKVQPRLHKAGAISSTYHQSFNPTKGAL